MHTMQSTRSRTENSDAGPAPPFTDKFANHVTLRFQKAKNIERRSGHCVEKKPPLLRVTILGPTFGWIRKIGLKWTANQFDHRVHNGVTCFPLFKVQNISCESFLHII